MEKTREEPSQSQIAKTSEAPKRRSSLKNSLELYRRKRSIWIISILSVLFVVLICSILYTLIIKGIPLSDRYEEVTRKKKFKDLNAALLSLIPIPEEFLKIEEFDASVIRISVQATTLIPFYLKCKEQPFNFKQVNYESSSSEDSSKQKGSIIENVQRLNVNLWELSDNREMKISPSREGESFTYSIRWPLNNSLIYCSICDARIPTEHRRSSEAPLFQINTIPLRMFLPISYDKLGLGVFHGEAVEGRELYIPSKRRPEERKETGKEDEKKVDAENEEEVDAEIEEEDNAGTEVKDDAENEEENDEEVKAKDGIFEDAAQKCVDYNKYFFSLLTARHVSHACFLVYSDRDLFGTVTEDPETPDLYSEHKTAYAAGNSFLAMNAKELRYERRFVYMSIVSSVKTLKNEQMDFEEILGKPIFTKDLNEIRDLLAKKLKTKSSEADKLNKTDEGTAPETKELDEEIKTFSRNKNLLYKEKEIFDFYKPWSPRVLSCLLYTGAREQREQKMLTGYKVESIIYKPVKMEEEEKNLLSDFKDPWVKRLFVFWKGSVVLEEFWEGVKRRLENTFDTCENDEEKKTAACKRKKSIIKSLIVYSKYLHYFLSEKIVKFEKVEAFFGWRLARVFDLGNNEWEDDFRSLQKALMFVVEAVNKIKMPMRSLHSAMKIKVAIKLQEAVYMVFKILKGDEVNVRGQLEELYGKNHSLLKI